MIRRISQHLPLKRGNRGRNRGQILVLYAGAMLALMGIMALVVDVGWYWSNTLRVQRAADAAALAGAVSLPGDPAAAFADARAEAAKNGYTDGVGGVIVAPVQDPSNSRRLLVRIQAPVGTFFMRVFGIATIQADRTANAEFVLPVPMGSPENYYGVFGPVRNATFTSTGTIQNPGQSAGFNHANTPVSGTWTGANNVSTNDGAYASSTTTSGSNYSWRDFGFNFTTPVQSIDGIEIRLRALTPRNVGSGSQTTCTLQADLSWNGGANWTALRSQVLTTSEQQFVLGGTTDTWGRSWTTAQLANGSGNFRVRLTSFKPNANCSPTRIVRVDELEARVTYTYTTSGTSTTTATYDLHGPGAPCANGVANCFDGTPAAGGQVLNARGFWATMNTEGAENVNGDAYQPYYDDNNPVKVAATCPSPTGGACYGPDDNYNYAVEMQPNTTGGYVYIFDPVFCATQVDSGTGDRWFSGSNAVSSFYELYSDPNNTPYDLTDDTLVTTSGGLFRQIDADDSTMGGSNGANECRQQNSAYGDGRDYHNSWYRLNPNNPLTGGPNGTTYRIHTTGTDPNNVAQQRSTDGEQSFAIYATDDQAPNVYPKVYGLGTMQMFTPLKAAGSPVQSEFYMAQIDAVHAGKTLTIGLWDPGDTNPLTANLEILIPTANGWAPTTMNYTAAVGTTNGNATSACNSNTGSGVTSITTATPTSRFNGCWLTIDVAIPNGYQAYQSGWWKIRYTMNGTGTSFDVTTWSAQIRGNPVHLVQ